MSQSKYNSVKPIPNSEFKELFLRSAKSTEFQQFLTETISEAVRKALHDNPISPKENNVEEQLDIESAEIDSPEQETAVEEKTSPVEIEERTTFTVYTPHVDLKDKREEHDEIDYENIEYDAKEEIAQVEIQEAVNAQDDTYYNEFVEQKGRTVEIFTQAEAQEEATITCKSKSTIAIGKVMDNSLLLANENIRNNDATSSLLIDNKSTLTQKVNELSGRHFTSIESITIMNLFKHMFNSTEPEPPPITADYFANQCFVSPMVSRKVIRNNELRQYPHILVLKSAFQGANIIEQKVYDLKFKDYEFLQIMKLQNVDQISPFVPKDYLQLDLNEHPVKNEFVYKGYLGNHIVFEVHNLISYCDKRIILNLFDVKKLMLVIYSNLIEGIIREQSCQDNKYGPVVGHTISNVRENCTKGPKMKQNFTEFKGSDSKDVWFCKQESNCCLVYTFVVERNPNYVMSYEATSCNVISPEKPNGFTLCVNVIQSMNKYPTLRELPNSEGTRLLKSNGSLLSTLLIQPRHKSCVIDEKCCYNRRVLRKPNYILNMNDLFIELYDNYFHSILKLEPESFELLAKRIINADIEISKLLQSPLLLDSTTFAGTNYINTRFEEYFMNNDFVSMNDPLSYTKTKIGTIDETYMKFKDLKTFFMCTPIEYLICFVAKVFTFVNCLIKVERTQSFPTERLLIKSELVEILYSVIRTNNKARFSNRQVYAYFNTIIFEASKSKLININDFNRSINIKSNSLFKDFVHMSVTIAKVMRIREHQDGLASKENCLLENYLDVEEHIRRLKLNHIIDCLNIIIMKPQNYLHKVIIREDLDTVRLRNANDLNLDKRSINDYWYNTSYDNAKFSKTNLITIEPNTVFYYWTLRYILNFSYWYNLFAVMCIERLATVFINQHYTLLQLPLLKWFIEAFGIVKMLIIQTILSFIERKDKNYFSKWTNRKDIITNCCHNIERKRKDKNNENKTLSKEKSDILLFNFVYILLQILKPYNLNLNNFEEEFSTKFMSRRFYYKIYVKI